MKVPKLLYNTIALSQIVPHQNLLWSTRGSTVGISMINHHPWLHEWGIVLYLHRLNWCWIHCASLLLANYLIFAMIVNCLIYPQYSLLPPLSLSILYPLCIHWSPVGRVASITGSICNIYLFHLYFTHTCIPHMYMGTESSGGLTK